jgi:hypothetical protein
MSGASGSLAKLKQRWPILLLLAGGLGAAHFISPHLPKERNVDLALDDAASVTAVDVAWAAPDGEDALQGATYRFDLGKAPRKLRIPARLPDGRYTLDVTVQRGAQRETVHRVVRLDESGTITVRLR